MRILTIGLPVFVYFIKAFTKPPRMKIGKSNDPVARLKALQIGCPGEMKMMALIKCRSERHAFQVERSAHQFFEPYHDRGEWFKCTDFLVQKAWEFEQIALRD